MYYGLLWRVVVCQSHLQHLTQTVHCFARRALVAVLGCIDLCSCVATEQFVWTGGMPVWLPKHELRSASPLNLSI